MIKYGVPLRLIFWSSISSSICGYPKNNVSALRGPKANWGSCTFLSVGLLKLRAGTKNIEASLSPLPLRDSSFPSYTPSSIKWLTLVETIIVTLAISIQADIRPSVPGKGRKKKKTFRGWRSWPRFTQLVSGSLASLPCKRYIFHCTGLLIHSSRLTPDFNATPISKQSHALPGC